MVFDWKFSKECNVNEAYILGPNRIKIIDFKNNFLHVVGYSHSINCKISLKNLIKKFFRSKKI